ncbi:kynureninase [Endozoicomonas sp. OPT23]|uniref:kynureninase n=1 Tax=Endozoicomonas sp. OPT23 TaxID=2072845 RepID=UPI00129BC0C5|nr:kynureninase [Endozoicomonas sp. OPT23]MRI32800.1 kynureninase [Endozoicomonas sp. OPT23]
MPYTLDEIRAMDQEDPLAHTRSLFDLPEGCYYFCGNSLGAAPVTAQQYLFDAQQQWQSQLIQGWNQGWMDAPKRLGNLLAPLAGASQDEVLVCDNLSLNLYKLLGYITQHQNNSRKVILAEDQGFPSDSYICQSFCQFSGYEFQTFDPESISKSLGSDTATLVISQVDYRTGQLRDMKTITRLVECKGGEVIWDLAHSAGAMPVELNNLGVKYAVGCTYKYLNGGPGSPGFVYVSKVVQNNGWQPLAGWLGHKQPFAFDQEYTPSETISTFRTGTHSPLAYSALEASLKLLQKIDLNDVREKSLNLSRLFLDGIKEICKQHGIEDITPKPEQRGSQVALIHNQHGYAMVQALIARGVICDYREPGLMRFGFAPLYLSYEDSWNAGREVVEMLNNREYERKEFQVRQKVT